MKLQVNVRLLKAVVLLLTVLLVILGGLAAMRAWEEKQGQIPVVDPLSVAVESQDQEDLIYYDGGWYAPREDIETVLLLGLDKYEDSVKESYLNNEQADFLLLLVLDHGQEKCVAVQLNRDTMTEINVLGVTGASASTFTGQLALAHTYGSGGKDSCENTVKAVSKLLYGVNIDHYVSMTMDGVAELNDLAGGVTLEVLDDFTGIDDGLKAGETVTLSGEQALTYVRARAGLEDSTNLHRMERQRQYLNALQAQLKICTEHDTGFLLDSILRVSDYLVSDCTVDQLSDLSTNIQQYGVSEIKTLEGEAVDGTYVEFYVDEQSLQALVMELFYVPVES